MGYRSLRECVQDLRQRGELIDVDAEVDPYLEVAAIQRRVYAAHGPALYFPRIKGCQFPLVSNLFGTLERARYIFRDALAGVRQIIELKGDPGQLARHPWQARQSVAAAAHMLPKRVRGGPVLEAETRVSELPPIHSWPLDGGAFVTLPLVHTEDPNAPGWRNSNLGMYRIQLSGNEYRTDEEIGLHYQIHRGIGVHHAAALAKGEPLQVHIYVGGPPALTVAAVMPLPEGLPELLFAGALGRRRVRLVTGRHPLPVLAEADFCIVGTVDPERKLPEGPFGDHLGYYSLKHDYPVMKVEKVYHRRDAIWPFTVVGRPPQEDTVFGELIHELTGPAIPQVIPGVQGVHAVDAAGVHPLLLAIGSERYQPFESTDQPQEILTQAHAILGQGQLSLAKYLWIAAGGDDPSLDVHDVEAFLQHMLSRVDWRRDLHFHTCTTIDTLDYSGTGVNQGSKVVIAARGPRRRPLPREILGDLRLPEGFAQPRVALPGVLVAQGPRVWDAPAGEVARTFQAFHAGLGRHDAINAFPLVVVVDDSEFTAASLRNFLWVTFTRSDPARDIEGIESFMEHKHWGCHGSLVIDARRKPHHAPPLEEDPDITRRVDQLGAPGGPLHGVI